MAHLLRPRIGWEAERLAHFLLSRFSFVAQPVGIADDLGSDFFCTVFDIVSSTPPTISPRGSFAIQVKTNRRPIAAHNKIDYLMHLEMPFFIGIVDQSKVGMDVYTAERLSVLFATFGRPTKLSLRPVTRGEYDPGKYCRGRARKEIDLYCPYVSTLTVTDDRDSLQFKVDQLNEICGRASSNIATRRTEEHIYDMGDGKASIVAGRGSVRHFRNNFCKRLAEAFYNLDWILKHRRADFNIEEFELYESLYHRLGRFLHPSTLALASHAYKELKRRLDQTTADTGTSAK